ncbi:MAG: thiolase family protein [Gammaproteobacteria bacterium]|nr:thiolase family protein [Gammaproteobacteria bacterium]
MSPADSPVILGGSATAFGRRRDGSGWRDWVCQAARDALTDAAIEAKDVDALVVACESEVMALQLTPGAIVVDDLGLTPREVVRVESGGASGASAVRAAFIQVLSGLARRVLVVGFEHAASHLAGDDVRLLYGLSFDADMEGIAGVTATALYALSINLHMQRYGTTSSQMAHVSVKNHGNARFNPLAHKPMAITEDDVFASPVVSTPYRRLDCSLLSDAAAAVVVSAPRHAPGSDGPRVRIAGSGCATDHARLGDRAAPEHFAAKERAAAIAYDMAGIKSPGDDIDVAEIYDPFTGAEIQGIEALGLAGQGQAGPALAAGDFDADGRLPVNLSGGLIGQGGAPGASGIAQTLAVERLLRGSYWSQAQPSRELRRGVVDTHGGICTTAVVHVLERMG